MRLRFRRDDSGLNFWMLTGIIVVVLIIIAAWAIIAAADDPNMNRPSQDDKYRVVTQYRFTFTNMPGGIWWMKESDRVFRVSYERFNYDSYSWLATIRMRSFEEAGLTDFGKDNRFDFKLKLTVTGPNAWEEKETFKLRMQIGEGNKRDVDFGHRYCYVEEAGTYTVKAVLIVDAPAEDYKLSNELDNAVIWTHTKSVTIPVG